MTKEQIYEGQLETLGIYDEAFEGAVHSLCVLERELSRTMKAWKATAADKGSAPSVLSPLYGVITQQRRDIASLRDALGLTPKGLQKLKGKDAGPAPDAEKDAISRRLDELMERVSAYE